MGVKTNFIVKWSKPLSKQPKKERIYDLSWGNFLDQNLIDFSKQSWKHQILDISMTFEFITWGATFCLKDRNTLLILTHKIL